MGVKSNLKKQKWELKRKRLKYQLKKKNLNNVPRLIVIRSNNNKTRKFIIISTFQMVFEPFFFNFSLLI